MTNRKYFVLAAMLLVLLVGLAPTFGQDAPADIKVWIAFKTARLDWATAKANEFNALFPQYNVTVEGGLEYGGLDQKIRLAAEQGGLPSIVHYNEVSTTIARDSGNFKSIADSLGDRTEVNGIPVNFDDFVQPVAAYYTLDGKFTSMPWNASSSVMFSNMNFLKAAGVDTPPATWAEMDAACEKIMAQDSHPTYCFTWPNYGWFFEQWLAQQNALLANNDNGRSDRATEVVFNSDAGLAIFTWLKDMYDKGYLYYSGKRDDDSWESVDNAFLPGTEVAMAIYSSSDTAYYTDTGATNGFEVVASRLPYNQDAPDGWTGNLMGGGSLWLVNGLTPEQEEGALTFLLWLTNTDNNAEWHQVTGYFPVRTSSVEKLTEEGWFDEHPNFTVAGDQIADSKITPATQGAVMGAFPEIRTIVTTAIDTLLLTPDADAKALLDQAATDSDKVLEEYNQLNAP